MSEERIPADYSESKLEMECRLRSVGTYMMSNNRIGDYQST